MTINMFVDILRDNSLNLTEPGLSFQERTVTIRRQTVGGFGLSIKVLCVFCIVLYSTLELSFSCKQCLKEQVTMQSMRSERLH